MEENNMSINDVGLEAISAGGASSHEAVIDYTSITFDEYLTKIDFPGREGFPSEPYDSCIRLMKGVFEQLQNASFAVKQPERGSGK